MKRKAKIEICVEVSGKEPVTVRDFWWRLLGANGEIICHSESYTTRSNALRAARRAVKLMAEAEIK